MRLLRVLFNSIYDFFKDGGVMLAASLSYFSMLAIVPFCLIIITILGYILGEHQAFFNFFLEKLTGFFPEITKDITEELRKIITFKGIGKLSLILYGFLSFEFFSTMQSAMNAVFKVDQKRTFLGSVLLSFIVVTLIVLFLFISFLLSSAMLLIKPLQVHFPWLKIGTITAVFIKFIVPLLLVQFIAVSVYIILPKKKVKFFHAFWGGLFTAVMLEIAKHLFTWYVGSVTKLGTIYGSLTAFVLFLLWVYYSSIIFLIGGEIVHNLGEKSQRYF